MDLPRRGKMFISPTKIYSEKINTAVFLLKLVILKKSGSNDIRKMIPAIGEAILRKFISPIDNMSPVHIEEFYFICSGKINKEARDYLSEQLIKKQIPNFRIFDIDKIISIILDLIKRYNGILNKNYAFSAKSFYKYCDQIRNYEEKKFIGTAITASGYSEGKVITDRG